MKLYLRILIACLFISSVEVDVDDRDQNYLDYYIHQISYAKGKSGQDAILWAIDDSIETQKTDTAIVIWEVLIEHSKEINYDYAQAFCHYNLANQLNALGQYFNSYTHYEKCQKIYTHLNNKSGLARVHNGLGILYNRLNDFNKSLENHIISAKLFRETGDKRLGMIYLNIGGLFEALDSLEKSKNYLFQSEEILLKEKDTSSLINCYINLGEVYSKEGNSKAAHDYLHKSYLFSQNNGDISDKFFAQYYWGKYLFRNNNITAAKSILLEASSTTTKEGKSIIPIESQAKFTLLMSQLYEELEILDSAFYYLKLSMDYEIRSEREHTNAEISRLDFQRLKDNTELLRTRKNLLIIIELTSLLFSFLFLIVLYRSYRHKQKANQLLTELDELKTQLYSDITHELRTPLTLILGPLEQMLTSEARKKPSRHQIKLMRRNANSILSLVNQMLDLSKIDAKSLKLELMESDIVKFIKVRFVNFASLAKQKNIKFNRYLPPDKKIRFFDNSKLEKIINNLLSNAIKFTPEGGQVFCFASFPKKNQLELTIQDTGKGISADELSKIFNRFHQVNHSIQNGGIGTGIGLSLTKELVELMHGTIAVESVVEEGTKFKIQLPLGKEHLSQDEYVIAKNKIPDNGQNNDFDPQNEPLSECEKITTSNNEENYPHVLVVDDHKEISEFIKENLMHCYSVETAENGAIGLQKAIEIIPDLIVSDLMMPKMDGLEMSRKLKSDERTSHIPIIILTAKSKIADKLEGLEIGADAFLAKPFSVKELNLRIRKLIEQRRKLRERFTKNLNLEPKDIAVTSADEKFINRAMEIIEENIGNAEFEVRQFQEEMLMSRMQLFRKIKALTNQSPGEFIRTIRLKRAASLIDKNFGNIAQITYEVGFNNPSYFAKCFKDLFGKLPSEYMKGT